MKRKLWLAYHRQQLSVREFWEVTQTQSTLIYNPGDTLTKLQVKDLIETANMELVITNGDEDARHR